MRVTPADTGPEAALLDAAVAEGRIPGAVAMAGRGPATSGRWGGGAGRRDRGTAVRADTVLSTSRR